MRSAVPLFLCLVSMVRADGPPALTARDPEIEAILRSVSEARIRSRIEKLAGFGTRHTLSDAQSDVRGIGAARRWIKAEFDGMARENGGRLLVTLDSYMQPPARRVKVETEVVNVVATLPGKRSPDRVIVVGGHYDLDPARPTATPTSDAPASQ